MTLSFLLLLTTGNSRAELLKDVCTHWISVVYFTEGWASSTRAVASGEVLKKEFLFCWWGWSITLVWSTSLNTPQHTFGRGGWTDLNFPLLYFSPCKQAGTCAAKPRANLSSLRFWRAFSANPLDGASFPWQGWSCFSAPSLLRCQEGYKCVWSADFNDARCDTNTQVFGVELKLPWYFTQPLTNN